MLMDRAQILGERIYQVHLFTAKTKTRSVHMPSCDGSGTLMDVLRGQKRRSCTTPRLSSPEPLTLDKPAKGCIAES